MRVFTNTGSRGQLRAHVTDTCDEIGIDDGSISITIRTFLALRNETSLHWIDMGAGVLLLAQTKPNSPNSAVIYVYDKQNRTFWSLTFDDGQSPRHIAFYGRAEFESLTEEYSLTRYAGQPSLLAALGGRKSA